MTGEINVGNLPLDIAPFVGRERELTLARQLLTHVRLLTLVGPGGVGKTRLASRIAASLQQSLHDGAWIVDIGALNDQTMYSPERLYAHLALALRIRHNGSMGLDVIVDHLRQRRVLLVLDNCEYLVAETRALIKALLRAAPHLRIIATSRQILGVDGEDTLVVPPLSLADSVTLFVEHATKSGADASAWHGVGGLEDICRRLDGLPLAIRLAAGRARTLSIEQLSQHLTDRFRVLTDTRHEADSSDKRHATLKRVVEWSYDLCTKPEQRVWERASTFVDAFDLSAAEAVAGGDGVEPHEVMDLITGLVDKSVLTVDRSTSPARYYMLDMLREYGLHRLAQADDTTRVRDRHSKYYAEFVAHSAATWFGPAELDVMAAVHRQMNDILAAIDHSLATRDLPAARAICRDLVRVRAPHFWGSLDLVSQYLQRVLQASDHPTDSDLELADLAATTATAAWVAVTQGRHDSAQRLLAAAYDLLQKRHMAIITPVLFAHGGSEALGAGSPEAIGLLTAARFAFTGPESGGDQHMATMMWAISYAFAGTPKAAVDATQQYLRQAENAQAPWAISWASWAASLAALHNNDHARATEYISQCLRLQRDMDDQWGQTWSIELSAWIIADQLAGTERPGDEAKRAAWLLGAANARQDRLGVSLAGLQPLAQRRATAQAQIASVLDPVATAEAVAAGRRGHEHAIRIAIGEPTPRRTTASTLGALTDRERDIALLITQGLTSSKIGEQLFISRRTVDSHTRNILKKLGVHRRAEIAAWITTQLSEHA